MSQDFIKYFFRMEKTAKIGGDDDAIVKFLTETGALSHYDMEYIASQLSPYVIEHFRKLFKTSKSDLDFERFMQLTTVLLDKNLSADASLKIVMKKVKTPFVKSIAYDYADACYHCKTLPFNSLKEKLDYLKTLRPPQVDNVVVMMLYDRNENNWKEDYYFGNNLVTYLLTPDDKRFNFVL